MRRLQLWLGLAVFVMICPAVALAQTGEGQSSEAPAGQLTWDDPAGDCEWIDGMPDGLPLTDIASVTVESGEGALKVAITFHDDALTRRAAYVDPEGRYLGASPFSLYIDADNDEATGRGPSDSKNAGRKVQGYELRVAVAFGFQFENADGYQGRWRGMSRWIATSSRSWGPTSP